MPVTARDCLPRHWWFDAQRFRLATVSLDDLDRKLAAAGRRGLYAAPSAAIPPP
jgi:hypothetical protein